MDALKLAKGTAEDCREKGGCREQDLNCTHRANAIEVGVAARTCPGLNHRPSPPGFERFCTPGLSFAWKGAPELSEDAGDGAPASKGLTALSLASWWSPGTRSQNNSFKCLKIKHIGLQRKQNQIMKYRIQNTETNHKTCASLLAHPVTRCDISR